ncbi:MAG TPA: hypothetical protein VK961_23280 [Chthoniobacter sp.]|nr:hypothetical protein [Chthoniobacter sp.]
MREQPILRFDLVDLLRVVLHEELIDNGSRQALSDQRIGMGEGNIHQQCLLTGAHAHEGGQQRNHFQFRSRQEIGAAEEFWIVGKVQLAGDTLHQRTVAEILDHRFHDERIAEVFRAGVIHFDRPCRLGLDLDDGPRLIHLRDALYIGGTAQSTHHGYQGDEPRAPE